MILDCKRTQPNARVEALPSSRAMFTVDLSLKLTAQDADFGMGTERVSFGG